MANFEVGKCYQHESGIETKAVEVVQSTAFGAKLLCRAGTGALIMIGKDDPAYTEGWVEITETEHNKHKKIYEAMAIMSDKYLEWDLDQILEVGEFLTNVISDDDDDDPCDELGCIGSDCEHYGVDDMEECQTPDNLNGKIQMGRPSMVIELFNVNSLQRLKVENELIPLIDKKFCEFMEGLCDKTNAGVLDLKHREYHCISTSIPKSQKDPLEKDLSKLLEMDITSVFPDFELSDSSIDKLKITGKFNELKYAFECLSKAMDVFIQTPNYAVTELSDGVNNIPVMDRVTDTDIDASCLSDVVRSRPGSVITDNDFKRRDEAFVERCFPGEMGIIDSISIDKGSMKPSTPENELPNIKQPERFEIGKYYRHTSGVDIHIIKLADISTHGLGVLEVASYNPNDSNHIGVGRVLVNSTGNYTEITQDEWTKNLQGSR